MDFYSIWPYFIIIVFLLCIANSRLLNSIDNPQDGNLTRVQTLDGLRGFLAFGVFFHHVAFYHQHVTYGGWLPPPSRFFVNLGQTSVAMFFMITGYLFWTQALQARGKLDLLKLYVGRVFRIVPLYTVLAVIVLVNAGVMTEWRLQVSPFDLVIGIMKWLAGGLFSGVPVNGYHDTGAMAGVTWTLRYEWEFYASLVLTSLFARKMFLGLLFPAAAAMIAIPLSLIYPDNLGLAIILLFCIGMLVASLKQARLQMPFQLSQHFCSFATVVAIGAVLSAFDGVYRAFPIAILGIAFGLIASGASVFGLLTLKPSKRLGDISYGIYLFQAPVLLTAFSPFIAKSLEANTVLGHWFIAALAASCLIVFAALGHVFIERPFITLGRRFLKHVRAQRSMTALS